MDKKSDNNFEERNNFKQKINWWGAFSSNGKCILNFFKENMSNTFMKIYWRTICQSWRELEKMKFWDNHPVHKNLNSLKFYKEKGIKVIDFPPYSPDLNPIENIWGKSRSRLRKKSISLWPY